MNSHIVMPVCVCVCVCVCPGKHWREKWCVANTCNSTYFVPDPVLMPSCVCNLLCPPLTVLCSWHDSYAHLKTRKLRPRHCIWLTDGLRATKCQDSRPSAGRVVIFILKPGCLWTHWCLWAKEKKKEEKRASCLTPESRPRVFCHSSQSIRGMLPSFLVSSNPSQSGGAWTYSPKPSPRVNFPSPPWWNTDPWPARRAEGVGVGPNCPCSDIVN